MASAVTSVSRACLAARGQADPIEASVLDSQTRLLVLAGVLGALEDLDTALDNVEAAPGLAVGVLVRADRGIALNKNHGTLGQAEEEVAARALCEARDAEPARLAVVLGPAVAGDGVLEDLAAAARGLQLGRVGEVADDGDTRDGARRRGGEGAAGRGGAGRAAEEERRGHV